MWRALITVKTLLGHPETHYRKGRIHFALGGSGWSIALSPESAGRIRVEACLHWRPVDTKWCLAHDDDRLAEVVRSFKDEVELSAQSGRPGP